MASHDLTNTNTTILGATPGAIPGIDGNPRERASFAPAFSERFFKNWGGPRPPDINNSLRVLLHKVQLFLNARFRRFPASVFRSCLPLLLAPSQLFFAKIPLARNQYMNSLPGIFSCIRAGANTGAACIRTERIPLTIGKILGKYLLKYIFLYSRECEYRPHMYSRKN